MSDNVSNALANSLINLKINSTSGKNEETEAPKADDKTKVSLADMPFELRSLIYDYINEPRFVELRCEKVITTIWSPTKVPVGLLIHPESRKETMRWYAKCFAGTDGEANIYFDFRFDTLYFGASLTPSRLFTYEEPPKLHMQNTEC